MDVLYGEDMTYRYDEASYIHSQLLCAFEIVQRKLWNSDIYVFLLL
jgi:hypothetical protein